MPELGQTAAGEGQRLCTAVQVTCAARLARGDRTFPFPHSLGYCAVLILQQSAGAGSTAMLGKALPSRPLKLG